MSDDFLRLIPSSPFYIPDEKAINKALKVIRDDFSLAESINAEAYESPRFIDQGSNWVRVFCSNCNLEIDIDWWQSAMDQAYESDFRILNMKVPCCGVEMSLNDLRYDLPAGFAKFKIEIRNPGKDITESCCKQLESILGIPIRIIWAHY